MVQTKGKGFSYQLPSDCHVDTFFQPQLLDSGSSGTHRAEKPEKEKVATLLCQSMDSRNTLPSCYQREIEGKIQVWPKVSVSVNQSGPTLNLQHSVCVCSLPQMKTCRSFTHHCSFDRTAGWWRSKCSSWDGCTSSTVVSEGGQWQWDIIICKPVIIESLPHVWAGVVSVMSWRWTGSMSNCVRLERHKKPVNEEKEKKIRTKLKISPYVIRLYMNTDCVKIQYIISYSERVFRLWKM